MSAEQWNHAEIVTEIERLRVIIRAVRDALADNDVAGAELVLKNARVDP